MRRPLVIGNWKLNGNSKMVNKLITELCKKLINISNCTVAIAPPEIYLYLAKQITKNSNIALGAQNVDINLSGAFTGETSAKMLKDIGVKYVIIGHSERRIYHKESNEFIASKFIILKENGLVPVLCIGETEAENKANKTKDVCAYQIDNILSKAQDISIFEDTVIAYEPIWAVGTGRSATKKQAQETHSFIRSYIAKYNTKVANKVIIQYGGSVNTSNAVDFFTQKDIDGALIGNASLKVEDFVKIINTAEKLKTNYIA